MSRTKPFMLRRIASAGAAAAIVVSGFAAVAASLALTATPAAAANCTPSGAGVGGATVTVTPCRGLTNLESVDVTGTGFTPDGTVVVVECVPPITSQENCDLSNVQHTIATAGGDISAAFVVHESITIGSGPVTCLFDNCSVFAYQSDAGPDSPANDEIIGFGSMSPSPSPVVSPVVSPSPSPTPVVILAASPSPSPAPALPAAGSAGSPGPSGGSVPVEALLLAAVASAVVGALAWRARVYKKSQGT